MERRARERSLAPALTARLGDLTRPNWLRTTLARRIAAAMLVVLAVGLYLRGDPSTERIPVVVATSDLTPGAVLTTDNVRTVDVESRAIPDGAVRHTADIVGRTLAGAVRNGAMLTDLSVLGPRLAAASSGSPDSRVVPVRLADPAVTELLREGDRVDVVTASEDGPSAVRAARMLASNAAVVLVSSAGTGHGRGDRVVLLALSTAEAGAVAAASLSSALTVVLH
ncbi:flagella basal body P-ring formation protein FlgA [Antrihabitans sp. YC3-6]|uniref:Flagella basal body P-ring formation protein FlgA n=1 Tax=Antrihabitans stalagmiti TaxID=2799499 RepID=A0A934U4P4_9NOCA|nr:SAF domain-containing protein [Antrihabitans stalagmiti]MBJ8340547.1 flagella basal body P-ring formation protein FlgA [Antrihabitans stalagmiti]